MVINFLGTWEKENKTGNTGTKSILGNREHQNQGKTFKGTQEDRENFVGNKAGRGVARIFPGVCTIFHIPPLNSQFP